MSFHREQQPREYQLERQLLGKHLELQVQRREPDSGEFYAWGPR